VDPCESSTKGARAASKETNKYQESGAYINNEHSNRTIRISDTAPSPILEPHNSAHRERTLGNVPARSAARSPQDAAVLSFRCPMHPIFLICRGLGYEPASHLTVLPRCRVSYPMGAKKVRDQRGDHQSWSRHLCMRHLVAGLPPRLAGCPL